MNTIYNNRAFLYGDAVFETVKIVNNSILFFEDHYFRLMSSMRILRMEIPMNFTMEFLEQEILNVYKQECFSESARARITVFREQGGYYLPKLNLVDYHISTSPLNFTSYQTTFTTYEVDIYNDFHITPQLLSTLKTTNRLLNITGSIYARENDLDNCILLNSDKKVVEFLNGNLFLFKDSTLYTPPISDGCINGVMRKQILEIVKKMENIMIVESSISVFDLQQAQELFSSNVITGIQPVTKYRKKEFTNHFAEVLLEKLNQNLKLA
jgi:branched-chain amino acid aminotransferase